MFLSFRLTYGSNLSCVPRRGKLIPVYDKSPFITIIPHLAGNHLDGHADFDRVVVNVGELCGDHGTFVQFDEGNGVGCIAIVPGGGFVDGRE